MALRERNFRLYWFGQAVSNIGNWMQIVALGWFILQINNGSPVALGLLGLAQSLPLFTLSFAGGILADRFSRLKILIFTQSIALLMAFVLSLLAVQDKPPLWSLLLVATLSASVTAIDNPARQAFLSDLVSKDVLLNAVALNASVYNGAAVIGPTLAGLLILGVGASGCFFLNAISFLAVLLALVVIARAKARVAVLTSGGLCTTKDMGIDSQKPVSANPGGNSQPFLRDFVLLRHHPTVLIVLGIAAVTSFLGRPYLLLMPAFARLIQHVGPEGLGLMVAASGLGSFFGALVLAMLRSSRWLQRLLLLCGIGFGLALVIFALLKTFVIALPVLILCGSGATMTMTVANTLLQTNAPEGMRGRVMSLYTLIAAGLTPLGVFFLSGLGTLIGLDIVTILAGVAVIATVIAGVQCISFRDKGFRRFTEPPW